jgi:hypothetical protein
VQPDRINRKKGIMRTTAGLHFSDLVADRGIRLPWNSRFCGLKASLIHSMLQRACENASWARPHMAGVVAHVAAQWLADDHAGGHVALDLAVVAGLANLATTAFGRVSLVHDPVA